MHGFGIGLRLFCIGVGFTHSRPHGNKRHYKRRETAAEKYVEDFAEGHRCV